MKIYLSNGQFIEMKGAGRQQQEMIVLWFRSAPPEDVLTLNLVDDRKTIHLQKRHVIQIDVPQ